MIKANDLRIGNIVNYHETDTLFSITEISQKGIGVKNDEEETWIELDQFSPIPLTPEILDKVGFEKKEDDLGHPFHTLSKEKGSIGGYSNRDSYCEYLHQLQNNYYWSIGEELQINLKELVTIK